MLCKRNMIAKLPGDVYLEPQQSPSMPRTIRRKSVIPVLNEEWKNREWKSTL